ncbi:hypothetical protein, partial [Burkholderia cenocepacia]
RKEARSQIDKLYDVLAKLQADARNFHVSETFETGVAEDLTIRVRGFERQLRRVGCFNQDDLVPKIISLRRSITLRNFDSSTFTQQPVGSDILEEIATAVEDMEDEIERQFQFEFPARFPFVRLRHPRSKGVRVWSK